MRLFDWGAAGDHALERFGMAAWRPVAARHCGPSQLPSIAQHRSLQPAYDEQFLAWLFLKLAAVRSRGQLVKRLVRGREGRVLGWYVAYLQRRGLSQVMQIAARERNAPAVLDHLFHDAQRMGVAALTGQFEPSLFEALAQALAALLPPPQRQLPGLLAQSGGLNPILLGRAMITRMDGERWMGHHLEPFN